MPDLFEQMRRNPSGDWRISDIERLCRQKGLGCSPPRGGGSPYKIWHDGHAEILTTPYRRPIKAVYIRALIRFVEAVEGGR